jgi:TonB family protein
VILAVETIAGQVPLGSGSGASGEGKVITDTPANPFPGAAEPSALRSAVPPVPVKKAVGQKTKVKVMQAPSQAELERERAAMPIGLNPRAVRHGEEPSEGGLGDNRKAGTADGSPSITGAIGSRGYQYVDWGFPSSLPEESTLVITIVVAPSGLVKSAQLTRASGYPEIDQNAISKAKSMVFDPLPSNSDQVDMQGALTFNFQYKP